MTALTIYYLDTLPRGPALAAASAASPRVAPPGLYLAAFDCFPVLSL